MYRRFFLMILICIHFMNAAYPSWNKLEERMDSTSHWIAYPGDFGIYLHQRLVVQRTERNQSVPPSLWRVDSPYGIIEFSKRINLKKAERASLQVDGEFSIRGVGGKGTMHNFDANDFELPAGDYNMVVIVQNFDGIPAIRFKSESYSSDKTWTVHSANFDRTSAEEIKLLNNNQIPSNYALATKPIEGKTIQRNNQTWLLDFGKETFAFPVIKNVKGNGSLLVYYGESKEEALAEAKAETWDSISINSKHAYTDTLPTKAFRYVLLKTEGDITIDDFSALYEYLPVNNRGSFKSSDPLLNQIYDVSYYTLHLNTREVHLDGIKRDRWAWSGDAYQSNLMNFYSFFDEDVNKRTFWGLRGHEPQTRHINTILDYTFYWIISIYEHFLYTGDREFIKQIYPRLKSSMEFCLERLNKNGMAEPVAGDWVFIDWAPINKTGEQSFEQLLLIQSLKAFALCSEVVNEKENAKHYQNLYVDKLKQFNTVFWSDEKKAYLHHRVNGELKPTVTKYSNMFAVLYDMVDENRKQQIKDHVILNPEIMPITTPYMKFYELAALCEIHQHEQVLNFVKEYWGGMLKLGATSFWESYDPTLADHEHYAMYDRPFGKSLCHAWGANPIYLLGRYYLGVKPILPGYQEYVIEPHLGGLKWMEGVVPTGSGDIKLKVNSSEISITTASSKGGLLRFQSKMKPRANKGNIIQMEDGSYEMKLSEANFRYIIKRN